MKKERVTRRPVKAIRKVKQDSPKKGTRTKGANRKDKKVKAQEPAPKKQKTTATKTNVVPPVIPEVVTPRVQKPDVPAANALAPEHSEREIEYLNRIKTLESELTEQKRVSVQSTLALVQSNLALSTLNKMKMESDGLLHKAKATHHTKEVAWQTEKGELQLLLSQQTGNTMLFGAAL